MPPGKTPPWFPIKTTEPELSVQQDTQEELRILISNYERIQEKAAKILYMDVPDYITTCIAECVDFICDKEWENIVYELGGIQWRVRKGCEFWSKVWGEHALSIFLKKTFGPKLLGNLGTVIEVLLRRNCYPALREALPLVEGFVSKYESRKAEYQATDCASTSPPKRTSGSYDSGFSDQSMSPYPSHNSQSNQQHNTRNIDFNPCLTSTNAYQMSIEGGRPDTKPSFNTATSSNCVPQIQIFAAKIPSPHEYICDSNQPNPNGEPLSPSNLSRPFSEDYSMRSFVSSSSIIEYTRNYFTNAEAKKNDEISVLITHTDSDEDERIARELAETLRAHQINCFILADVQECLLHLDVYNQIIMIFDKVDFLVPVLTSSYLEEIRSEGNPNDFSRERLTVRYIHSLGQHHLMNANCLNFLIKSVFVEGVPMNEVRKRLEFQSVWKYPNNIPRFVRVLVDTKELKLQREAQNGQRQM